MLDRLRGCGWILDTILLRYLVGCVLLYVVLSSSIVYGDRQENLFGYIAMQCFFDSAYPVPMVKVAGLLRSSSQLMSDLAVAGFGSSLAVNGFCSR